MIKIITKFFRNCLSVNDYNCLLVISTLLFSLGNSFAQNNQFTQKKNYLARIEIPNNLLEYSFKSIGSKGLLLIAKPKPDEINQSNQRWKITKYNSDLEFEKSIDVNLDLTYCKMKGSFIDENYAYLLFKKCRNSYLMENQYRLFKLDLVTLKDSIIPFTLAKNSAKDKVGSVKFYPFGNSIALVGSFYPKKSFHGFEFVQISDLETNDSKLFKFDEANFNFKKSSILKFYQRSNLNEFNIIIEATGTAKKSTSNVYSIHLNEEGKVISQINLSEQIKDIEGKITHSQGIPINKDKYMYVDTYVSPKSAMKKVSNFMRLSEEGNAEGISITVANNQNLLFSKKIEFKELKSLNQDKFLNTDGNITKNKEKESVFRTLLVPHSVMKIGTKFLYLGELLEPIYGLNSDGKSVKNGYTRTKALLICFDENGQLIWDKTIYLGMQVNSVYDRRQLVTMQYSEELQQIGIIAYNKGVHKEFVINTEGIELTSKKLFTPTNSDVSLWYDRFYFVSGTAKIKDKDKRKEVIFVNKYKTNFKDQ